MKSFNFFKFNIVDEIFPTEKKGGLGLGLGLPPSGHRQHRLLLAKYKVIKYLVKYRNIGVFVSIPIPIYRSAYFALFGRYHIDIGSRYQALQKVQCGRIFFF